MADEAGACAGIHTGAHCQGQDHEGSSPHAQRSGHEDLATLGTIGGVTMMILDVALG